jgi:hypothetical protein
MRLHPFGMTGMDLSGASDRRPSLARARFCVWKPQCDRDGSVLRQRVSGAVALLSVAADRRLTNAFSKKLTNLKMAYALHFAFYNFSPDSQNKRTRDNSMKFSGGCYGSKGGRCRSYCGVGVASHAMLLTRVRIFPNS